MKKTREEYRKGGVPYVPADKSDAIRHPFRRVLPWPKIKPRSKIKSENWLEKLILDAILSERTRCANIAILGGRQMLADVIMRQAMPNYGLDGDRWDTLTDEERRVLFDGGS